MRGYFFRFLILLYATRHLAYLLLILLINFCLVYLSVDSLAKWLVTDGTGGPQFSVKILTILCRVLNHTTSLSDVTKMYALPHHVCIYAFCMTLAIKSDYLLKEG